MVWMEGVAAKCVKWLDVVSWKWLSVMSQNDVKCRLHHHVHSISGIYVNDGRICEKLGTFLTFVSP